MPTIHWIEYSWTPQAVPDEGNYQAFRSFDKRMLDNFLKQEKRTLKARLHAENPYQWKPVLITSAVGIAMLLLGDVVPKNMKFIGELAALVLLYAGWRALVTAGSRDYKKCYKAQRHFYTTCWKAANKYDYADFYYVVASEFLRA